MKISNNLKQRLHNFLKLLLTHSLFFILGTAIFISLFHTGLFKSINIFFYRGIVLLLVSCALILLFQYIYKQKAYKTFFTNRDIILNIVLIFCLNIVFFTHIPVTADRSISVFMLGYMNNNSDKTISNQDMTNIFINKYLYEYNAITKRFNEQIVSGNIVKKDDGFKITKRGQMIMKIYFFIVRLFAIDNKIVSP